MSQDGLNQDELPDTPAQLKNIICQKLAEICQLEHHLELALKSKYGLRLQRLGAAQRTRFDLGEPTKVKVDETAAEIVIKRRKGVSLLRQMTTTHRF